MTVFIDPVIKHNVSMQRSGQQKLLFIVNPAAGKNNVDWKDLIGRYFGSLSHSFSIHEIEKDEDPAILQGKVNGTDWDKVVAVGGDGTVKSVAELLVNTRIPLGIIPAGSANGMARELNLPLELEPAMKIILEGKARQIDLIRVNNEWCIHISDLGLNALLMKYFDQSKARGKWAYVKLSWKVLWNRQLLKLAIHCNNETFQRKAFMVVMANASKYGLGTVINPEGSIDDGAFELVIVRKLSLAELLKMLITHKPFDPNKIELIRTTEARISSSHRFHFQVDGEYRGKFRNIEAHIASSLLTIMLPSEKESPRNVNRSENL